MSSEAMGLHVADKVVSAKYGKGAISSIDDTTYSIPLFIVLFDNGDKIALTYSEFRIVV